MRVRQTAGIVLIGTIVSAGLSSLSSQESTPPVASPALCSLVTKEEVGQITGSKIECVQMKEGSCLYLSTPCGALTGEKIVVGLSPGPTDLVQSKKAAEEFQQKMAPVFGKTYQPGSILELEVGGDRPAVYQGAAQVVPVPQLIWTKKGKGYQLLLSFGFEKQGEPAARETLVKLCQAVNKKL